MWKSVRLQSVQIGRLEAPQCREGDKLVDEGLIQSAIKRKKEKKNQLVAFAFTFLFSVCIPFCEKTCQSTVTVAWESKDKLIAH